VYHGFPDVVGYNAFRHMVRNYFVVTAACMATRGEVLEAGGYAVPRQIGTVPAIRSGPQPNLMRDALDFSVVSEVANWLGSG